MALYPIRLLKDKNRHPFFPFNTLESVLVDGTNKNLADVLNDIYTKAEVNTMFATELSKFSVYPTVGSLPATARDGAVAAVNANNTYIMYMYYSNAWRALTQKGDKGASFEYNWDGTKLGVKTDEEQEYEYTDLKGEIGLTPDIQIGNVTNGNAPAVTRRGTDEEPIFDFVLQKGDKPVKGVDYFTASDKAEMVAEVTEDATSAFNVNAAQKTTAFNNNATDKTTAFNTNASDKTTAFNTNATNKTTAFDENATSKTNIFNGNYTEKTTAFNTNASDKTTAFNNNATAKTTDFDTNASNKTTAYNDNAQSKIDYYDAHVQDFQADLDAAEERIDVLEHKVDDLETNQLMNTVTGTNIDVTDAHETEIVEGKISKLSTQEVITAEQGTEVINKNITVSDVNTAKENYITLKGDTTQNTTQGNQLVDFSSFNTQSIYDYSFVNDILTYSCLENKGYPQIYKNILSLLQANVGKTIYYKSDNYTQSNPNASVSTIIKYRINDGSMRYTENLNNNNGFVIPEDLTYAVIYQTADNAGTSVANTVTVTKPLLYFDNNTYEPYTNGPAPNPDYPQEVKTVKGYSNLLQVSQLASQTISGITFTNNGDGTYTVEGTSTQDTRIYLFSQQQTSYLQFPEGDYILNGNPNPNIRLDTAIENNYYPDTGSGVNIHITSQLDYLRIYIASGTTVSKTIVKPMLVEGDQELPYIPYGNYINVRTIGKNLLNPIAYSCYGDSNYVYALSNNPITSPYTTNGTFRGVGFVAKVKAGQTYVFSSDVSNAVSKVFGGIYASENDITDRTKMLQRIESSNNIFTANYDGYALVTKLASASGTQISWTYAQLEQGSTATTYEPYQEQYYPIKMNNIELCKAGTHQDYFFKRNGLWYLHKEIGKIVLDGDENITQNSATFNNVIRYSLTQSAITYLIYKQDGYCNQLPILNSFVSDSEHTYIYNNLLYLFYNKNRIADLDALKTYLSTNNFILYAILTTPTDTQITDVELVSQLDALYTAQIHSTTNIMSYSDLEPYIDLKYNVVTPAPSPERPSEVKTVKGYRNLLPNTLETQEKNGLTITKNSDGTVKINGTATDTTYLVVESFVFDENKTYTLSGCPKDGGNSKYFLALQTSPYSTDIGKGVKISNVSGSRNIRISINANIVCNNIIFKPMIIEGDQQLPYVPYGTNWIYTKTTGKNLWGGFKFSKTNNGVNFTYNEDGSISASGTATDTALSMLSGEARNYYKTLSAGTYTISGGVNANQKVQVYDSNGTELASAGSTNPSFTLTEETQIWIRMRIASGEVVNTTYKIQLEKSSVDTPFEAYKEKIITLPLNNNELVGIRNYKDEYIVDKNGHCYLNKKTDKVIIDGTNIKAVYKSITYGSYMMAVTKRAIGGIGLCSHTKNIIISNSALYDDFLAIENVSQMWFKCPNIESITDMNNWFINNNVTVYRVLETPELIDLQTTVDIRLFKGVNNIINSEDADMRIRYVQDINTIINEIKNAILEIGGE